MVFALLFMLVGCEEEYENNGGAAGRKATADGTSGGIQSHTLASVIAL